MTKLFVDVDALKELSRQLHDIKESLQSAKVDLHACDNRLGSDRIKHALDHFVHDWQDGRKHIVEEVDGLIKRVNAAAAAYGKQEAGLSKAAGGGG